MGQHNLVTLSAVMRVSLDKDQPGLLIRVWIQLNQHPIEKSCTTDKKLMAFFSNRVASLLISLILQKNRSTILRMA